MEARFHMYPIGMKCRSYSFRRLFTCVVSSGDSALADAMTDFFQVYAIGNRDYKSPRWVVYIESITMQEVMNACVPVSVKTMPNFDVSFSHDSAFCLGFSN